ncbi:MAG: GIY-YIG nuclease family protein, partial [Planctomycetes bacterium]|nr:GIY-YIG nuclease family protein [Planctomycetota bacterium]
MSVFPWPGEGLDAVPERPGVYLFRSASGAVLYVGKARNLRSRLATYRAGGDGRINVRFLERDATEVETIVTRTEQEALLLEDERIKRHQPPHNVRLKDDKSFLMIRVDLDEPFPRLKFVRAHRPKAGKSPGRARFFGPFASARAARRALADLHRVVPLRDCTDQVMRQRSRPCLKHSLGLCAAPCVGLIDERAYAENVERAVRVLAGDIDELERDLEARMLQLSERQEYERAAALRDRLAALRRTVERQGVLSSSATERDVLALARSGERVLVHRLCIRRGKLAESRGYLFRSELPDAECLHGVLTTRYSGAEAERPREIVLPLLPAENELLSGLL